ncbi:OstA-like protein [Flammeovirgaceae bacterium SG7u.111]|nr:OstA-like protein [Flammeovirgaceae bacterium SG7u.132]WPO37014.1 OstA-like protein [Flammeovirgaceae bacterium SG7u.111]
MFRTHIQVVAFIGLMAMFFASSVLIAQDDKGKPKKGESDDTKVELIKAGSIFFKDGLRYVKPGAGAPRVVFKRDSTMLYCDLATQNPETEDMAAYGNVIIEENPQKRVTADTLFYTSTSGIAELRGNVVLVDSANTLKTQHLYYDMNSGNAYYLTGGNLVTDEMNLSSKKGYYRPNQEMIAFKTDVVMVDRDKGQRLETDSLRYFTVTKDAFFEGFTTITSPDGVLKASKGKYNTVTEKTTFEGNTTVDSKDYSLKGDLLKRDKLTDYNIVSGNVELYSKQEFATVYGDELRYQQEYSNSKVYGYPYMKRPFGTTDSLFLAADTLLTINDTINNIRQLHAYANVKIYSNEMQGICDSLVYDYNDSTLTLFQDPVIWNGFNQIKAEKIVAYIANQTIDSLFLEKNAFVIQQDTLKNYNQIKGREITAKVKGKDLDWLYVNGNSQTLYFSLQGDSLLMGMNKIECANMLMTFADSSQLLSISARKAPNAKFTPTHLMLEPETRLKGFRLRYKERPEKFWITDKKTRMEIEDEKKVKPKPKPKS